jgi:hypothetical protein
MLDVDGPGADRAVQVGRPTQAERPRQRSWSFQALARRRCLAQ